MFNADMRVYNYFTFGEKNAYGQRTVSKEPVGKITMAIYLTSQSIQDNINYKDCRYVALTHANVDDTYVIEYEGEKLKVLYVNPRGRFKQVFLAKI